MQTCGVYIKLAVYCDIDLAIDSIASEFVSLFLVVSFLSPCLKTVVAWEELFQLLLFCFVLSAQFCSLCCCCCCCCCCCFLDFSYKIFELYGVCHVRIIGTIHFCAFVAHTLVTERSITVSVKRLNGEHYGSFKAALSCVQWSHLFAHKFHFGGPPLATSVKRD